jgi:hypothetical protein
MGFFEQWSTIPPKKGILLIPDSIKDGIELDSATWRDFI